MTLKLDPPAVPPLTQVQRDRLRRQVMRTARPETSRRWVAPLIAVGGVAAVVAGSLVVLHPSPDPGPEVSGSTSSTKVSGAPATVPSQGSTVVLPFPTSADLGAVPQSELIAAVKKCRVPGGGPKTPTVLWSRQVAGVSPGSRVIVMLVKAGEPPRGDYGEGVAVCQSGAPKAEHDIGSYMVQDLYWHRRPTGQYRASVIVGSTWKVDETTTYRQQWTLYRASPELARIESRFSWKGGSSPWIKGLVADGFAYTDSRAVPSGHPGQVTEQIRAYDTHGRLVPVQP